MNSNDLFQIAHGDSLLSPVFAGVFACDQLPLKRKRKHKAYIVNIDPKNKPGSHWIAIFFDKEKCYYFDSYGMKCRNVYILRFIRRNSKVTEYNETVYQSPFSKSCGIFCLYFLTHIVRGKRLNELTNNKEKNEKLMCSFAAKQMLQFSRIPQNDVIQYCVSLL